MTSDYLTPETHEMIGGVPGGPEREVAKARMMVKINGVFGAEIIPVKS